MFGISLEAASAASCGALQLSRSTGRQIPRGSSSGSTHPRTKRPPPSYPTTPTPTDQPVHPHNPPTTMCDSSTYSNKQMRLVRTRFFILNFFLRIVGRLPRTTQLDAAVLYGTGKRCVWSTFPPFCIRPMSVFCCSRTHHRSGRRAHRSSTPGVPSAANRPPCEGGWRGGGSNGGST